MAQGAVSRLSRARRFGMRKKNASMMCVEGLRLRYRHAVTVEARQTVGLLTRPTWLYVVLCPLSASVCRVSPMVGQQVRQMGLATNS